MKLKILALLLLVSGFSAFADDINPLLLATGTAKQVQAAIDKGATPGENALVTAAAMNRDPGVLNALLKAGAKIEVDGDRALLAAVLTNTAEVVTALIKAGANVNAKDDGGLSVLIHAVSNPSPSVVQVLSALIGAGADLKAKDSGGRSVLDYAMANPQAAQILPVLLKAGAQPQGELRFATSAGIVTSLVEAGANANEQYENGRTPLMLVVGQENPLQSDTTGIATALLKAGAKADAVDSDGRSVLMYAAGGRDADVIPALVAAGAKLDLADPDGTTALMIAVSHADSPKITPVILALLKAGADPNAQNKDGWTALTLAAVAFAHASASPDGAGGRSPTVDALLTAGANPDLTDKAGYTFTYYMPPQPQIQAIAPAKSTAETFAWTDRSSAGRRQWASVASDAGGTRLVAAVWDGDLYSSTDAGLSWTTRVPVENERLAGGVGAPRRVASSLDGVRLAALIGSFLSTSADGGVHWFNRRPNQGSNEWWSFASSGDGVRLAATDDSSASRGIWTSKDSGVTWTGHQLPGEWRSVASSSDGSHLVAVEFGKVVTSADSGTTWSEQKNSGSQRWHQVVSSADGSHLAALVAVTALTSQIVTSTDYGAHWVLRTGQNPWSDLASSADGKRLAATLDGGDICTSTDAGVHWVAQKAAGSRRWKGIASSADGTRLVAVATDGDIWTGVAGHE